MSKKKFTVHGKNIILNRNKLKSILDSKKVDDKGMDFSELHRRIVSQYGLDLSYKGFMSLTENRSTWKLLYAYAIADVLDIGIDDIFEVVEVDIDRAIKEKEDWQEKYQKKQK